MNYQGKRVAITGANGFLGRAIYRALEDAGADVWPISGDIRDPKRFENLGHDIDYLFHFAAPSSQVLFTRNPFYCAEVTLRGFMLALAACERNGIKLVYPSTGLLSQNRSNAYARCKALCEDMAAGTDALGLRIFATYGPGEAHKRDYASVPYLIARDLVAGRQPVLYGDGSQVRDFIYITDVVQATLILAEECNDPVIDVGSGEKVNFRDIVKRVNTALGTNLAPKFVDRPTGYVHETLANVDKLAEYYTPQVSFAQGVKELTRRLKKGEA